MAASPIIGPAGWQVALTGTSQTPTTVVEPYPMPHPQDAPYHDFQVALKALKTPVTEYVKGYLEARALLVGGAAPDFVTGKTVALFQDARAAMKPPQVGYDAGGMDAWRLYSEEHNTDWEGNPITPAQWVDATIVKMSK